MMMDTTAERIGALRAAAEAERWDEFADLVRTWVDAEPTDPVLKAGQAVAALALGVAPDRAISELIGGLDRRLHDRAVVLDYLRAGRPELAREPLLRELANDDSEDIWLDIYAHIEPSIKDPVRHLFATPDLVAGCVINRGKVVAMAAKSHRMSADSLGNRAELIWEETQRLAQRLGIDGIRGIRVVGTDGGWVLETDGAAEPRMATALVSSPANANELAARARAIVNAPEAPA